MEDEDDDSEDDGDEGDDESWSGDVAGDDGLMLIAGDFGDFDDVVSDIVGVTGSSESPFSLSALVVFPDSFEAARDLCLSTEFDGDEEEDEEEDDALLSFLFTDDETEEFWVSSSLLPFDDFLSLLDVLDTFELVD